MSAPTTVPVDEGGSAPNAQPRATTYQPPPPPRTAPPYTGGAPVVVNPGSPVRRNPDGTVTVLPPPPAPGTIYPGTSSGGLTPIGVTPTYDRYLDRPRLPIYDEPEDNGMMPLVTLALLSSMNRGGSKKKKKKKPQVIVIQAPPATTAQSSGERYQPYSEDQATNEKELRIGLRNNQSLVKK